MPVLVLGLVVFLGVHSVRLVAEDWRSRRVAVGGEKRWKRLFTVVSLVGLVLTTMPESVNGSRAKSGTSAYV